jgi:putative glutamine amidotransferase
MRPKIGISKWGHSGYYQMIYYAGGEPVGISTHTLLANFDKLQGLVIPGGVDVCPDWYGEKPKRTTQSGNLDRDALEIALIRRAIDNDIPVLGVCRGHQLLNVALGGSLVQHIDNHVTDKHLVKINSNSKHLSFIGNDFWVNSLHHQAIDKLGKGLKVVAKAQDGTIEAVESTQHPFVVGVQWHPEMSCNTKFEQNMQILVEKFVKSKGENLATSTK